MEGREGESALSDKAPFVIVIFRPNGNGDNKGKRENLPTLNFDGGLESFPGN